MADKDKSFITKVYEAGNAYLDNMINKAKIDLKVKAEGDDVFYRKSIYMDPSYNISTQGYRDKTARISFTMLKHMGYKDSIIAAILQTRQNQVASFAKVANDAYDKGFRIVVKEEEKQLLKIMEELFPESKEGEDEEEASDTLKELSSGEEGVSKAEEAPPAPVDGSLNQVDAEVEADLNEDSEVSDKEKERTVKEELDRRTKKKREELAQQILTCGSMEDRSFESKRWNFDSFLRAVTRDSLTYDQFAVEFIPDQSDKLHHWIPVDASTIRYASPSLKNYRDFPLQQAGSDILFPEKELEGLERREDALELDDEKLREELYKYVQVIRGKLVRAFTETELSIGMRNPVTDIYASGYSIAELELLLTLVSSHIFTENYNHSYYTQGFSAKGILHIKAPLPRRKLETLRIEWQHWLKGNKNSFQTPIFAGMDEIKWIPLTQSHSDMEFSNWMNYLIRMITAIFQIDPAEIGYALKDEGGRGGGISGDNTQLKMEQSKDKGLIPLLKYMESFINTQIMEKLDPEYKFEFVGLREEDKSKRVERQGLEIKFKKSVNEVRAEDNMPPIAGADDLILEPTYLQWFMQFHPDGKKLQEKMQEQQQEMGGADQGGPPGQEGEGGPNAIDMETNSDQIEEEAFTNPIDSSFKKSKVVKIEYYGRGRGSKD